MDHMEVTPDAFVDENSDGGSLQIDALHELRDLASDATVIVHGVGLSIGSHDGWSDDYLRCLDQLMDTVNVAWHSEHLGYTMVRGEFLGTMLPLPRTKEALELAIERVAAIQERYPSPFLLENVVRLLPDYDSDYTEAEFLNELTSATGCGLLLDVYNLECDRANNGFEIEKFLNEIDLKTVREIHVAGGVEHRGIMLDVHSRPMKASTLNLAKEVFTRAPYVETVTYELLDEAAPILGPDLIASELVRMRAMLESAPTASRAVTQ
ncbi:DUF692 domain-containing protein [Streptomyces sp. NRRL S-455]|uniref:DUF692 domain-containing protein n=1 Tax=Streptomyces sp. NRRL S-455 TaxID=1463908 RepID=UPI00131A5850|nr:DUF692 family multinuclear iron-containing protein [Streptomyces sp. NRRL S-455]